MTTRAAAGAMFALVGLLMIFLGLFSFIGRCAVPGAACPSPRPSEVLAYGGVLVLAVGVTLLFSSAWRGSLPSSVLSAVATIPLTWVLYEIVRQSGCPLIADPGMASACFTAFGEMTAPVLSLGAGGLVLLLGWRRWRALRESAAHRHLSSRDIHAR